MNKKIITLLIILIFSTSMAWAENNTTEAVEIEDMANYIIPTSISGKGIEFSDGFIGFCLDGGDLTTSDRFTQEPTKNNNIQNYIKLAIIECYKQSKEDYIPEIVTSICDGSYLNSENEVINAVLNSNEKIGNTAVVDIDNTTEATFNFELLKSVDGEQSDCLAYTVSMKTVKSDEVLGAAGDESPTGEDTSEDVKTDNASKTEDPTGDVIKEDTSKTEDKKSNDNKTVDNETNKTGVNKTTTVIIHEKNTTIITKNNVKNDTPQETLMKTAGNPLFILVVVIAIIAVVIFEKHRRG